MKETGKGETSTEAESHGGMGHYIIVGYGKRKEIGYSKHQTIMAALEVGRDGSESVVDRAEIRV